MLDGRRRRLLTRAAWGTAPAVLAVFAVINPGAPVSQMDLHDGTVWLTNQTDLRLGRYNPVVEELNAGLIAGGSPFDVLQDGFDVLLVQQGTVAVVDPANVALAGQTSIGGGTLVSMAAGTTAVTRSADGNVWARPTAMIGGLRVDVDEPDLELGEGGAAVVARSGAVLAVDAEGAAYRVRVTPESNVAEEDGRLDGGAGAGIDAITAVGDEVVVLSGTTLHTRSASVDLSQYQGLIELQQPGPAADSVLVGVQGALLDVPLDGGEPRVLPAGQGKPSAPVRVGACVHGAWASATQNYLRVCGDDAPVVEDLAEIAATDELVFRVNRDVVALNDVGDGRLWLPLVDAEVREPNWTDIQEDTEDEPDESEREAVTAETLQAECSADAAPPSAVDDEFGVRRGRTMILPVVDNDASSACGILAIDTYEDIEESFGTLTPVYGGRAFQLTVRDDASGSTSFRYTVIDGRDTAAPATALVTLTVRGDGQNEAPAQLRVGAFTVEQGGIGTYDVLADFRDPDGDPMVLVSAVGTGGSARARGDGRLRFQADGSALGRQAITVVVSDGVASVEGTLYVDIRPAGSLPPVLEPVHVVTYVDKPATVNALDYVRSQGREPARLAGVEEVVGLELRTDLDAGTFTVTGRTPGTFYVPYVITAPPQQATGLARVDVLEAPQELPPPTAVLDVALLPPGGEVTIDPLANDTDPTGGVLVVQSVSVPGESPLRVAVLDHQLLRISTTRTFETPEVFTYTITNGLDTAVGQVVVQPVPAAAGQQPPVVPDVTATVRTGGVVTIPVLEGAFDPDGEPLTLVPTLVEAPTAGLMFISGDVLRYQAPSTPMEVRATFEVSDPMRNVTAATVTIAVHASDAESKAPPRPVDLTSRAYAGDEVTIDVPLVGIDDDGDGVTLLGVDQPPTKGLVSSVGSDSIVYRALPGEIGTDTFTYAVEDWTGQRAVATVRVGIAARPSGAVPVVTRDDAVTVRPGQTIEVRVLANDDGGGAGELTLDEALTIQPEGVVARTEGRRILVEAPDAEGVVQILYTARNDRGGYDTGVLTVTVDEDAPFLPPVAADIVVPAVDTINKTQVAVNVMETAQNPSGSLADLTVEVPVSAGATAVAPGDGTVVVTLVDQPQTLPYLLVNEHPDAGRVSSYAFITVPALGDFPPMHRPGTDDLSVIAGEPLTLELAELVRVAPGRSPRIGDRSRVVATKADGSPLVVDDDTLRFTARADYSGPASVTVHVTDGPLSDPTTHDATLTFEIMVLAREEHPPTFTPSVLEVPQASSGRVDLAVFTSEPASVDEDAASRYTYRLGTPLPAGFDVSLDGSMLVVAAQMSTARGTVGAIPIELGFGGTEPLAVQVDTRVVASREPLARVLDFTVPDGVEGGESVVRVLEGAFNPFAPSPLSVVSATVETPGAGTAHVSGSTVVVNPAAGYIGQLVVRYTVKDVLPDLDRMVEGRITVVVRGKPATPAAPRVVESRDRAVALAWEPPANNGEPIDSYRVTASGGLTQTCPSTACTITGLTNDVTYTFTVAAHNAVGWSEPSPASGEARPDTQPLAPAAPRVERGDRRLDVSWTPPENPGSPIIDYLVEISPATPSGQTSFTTSATSIPITGLANGTVYSLRVRARNSAPQPGAWGPAATGKPARVPDAPLSLSATDASEGSSIAVTWAAPPDGGEPIEEYELRVDGAPRADASCGVTQCTFPAVQGHRYTIEVRARNAVGWSPWTSTQGQIWGRPGQVPSVEAVDSSGPWNDPGQGRVRVTWQRTNETGGDGIDIDHYEITLTDAAGNARTETRDRHQTSMEFYNLRGGAYTATVTAVNTKGARGDSRTSAPVTVVTLPGQVLGAEVVVATETSVTISWPAVADGGAAVQYGYRLQTGGNKSNGDATTLTLTGTYADGDRFRITLWATNADGESRAQDYDFTLEIEGPTPPPEGEGTP
ncbi:hypothetical protein N867_05530 [Actinotalea fermentans ATCC 43279 = JCM 9966 = DSM 3133]|uniref:ATPase AAA n=1 Tax=Actinotalea fermentans TaxID=43671 RepID=A0A511Z0B8_9CELL|nr:hypothetical protein N867_05530 [Actinotalea fermentans ATCC 43279 = JCM 9966 = DSM 3133]GEN80911.1 ATPase AAA [Actinotalea fermentans]